MYCRADPKFDSGSAEPDSLLEDLPPPQVEAPGIWRINNCDYCLCGHCKPMPSSEESVCCKERNIGLHIMTGKF